MYLSLISQVDIVPRLFRTCFALIHYYLSASDAAGTTGTLTFFIVCKVTIFSVILVYHCVVVPFRGSQFYI